MSDSHYPWIPQTAPQKQRNAEITTAEYPTVIEKDYFESHSNLTAREFRSTLLIILGATIGIICFAGMLIYATRSLVAVFPLNALTSPSTTDLLITVLGMAGQLLAYILLKKGSDDLAKQHNDTESHILTGTAVIGQHPEIARIFHRIIATDDRTEQTAERYRNLCDAAEEARQAIELGVAGPLELEAHNELVKRLAASTKQSIDEHASVRALEKKEQAEIERIQQEEEAKLNDAAYAQDQDAARAASILERAPDLDARFDPLPNFRSTK